MEPVARHPPRRLALGATFASGLVVLVAGATALWLPGNLGLSTTRTPSGQAVVTWVAPNGPAWSADVLPGDRIVGWDGTGRQPPTLTVRSGAQLHLLGAAPTSPPLLCLLMATLGLVFLGIGALVLGRSTAGQAAWALWRLCVLSGLALGVAAAGMQGLEWALAFEFVALRLVGPALLELALALPVGAEAHRWMSGWRRALVWLVPTVLLALYPFCWLWPAPLFGGVQLAGGVFFIGAIIATCVRIGVLWRKPLPEPQHAQLRYVALGVVGGFTPLLLFALLPDLLVGHPLAPPEVLICALALFPVSVGMAIVRHEFLAMPSLLYRRTLHLVLHGVLLGAVALTVGLLLTFGTQQGGWARIVLAMGTTVLLALLVTQWARLVQASERLLLPDTYEPLVALHRLHKQMFLAEAHEQGTAPLREIGENLDLRFAILQTAHQQYAQGHPREPIPDAVLEAVTQQAQALLTTSPVAESWVEQIEGLPVRVVLIRDQAQTVRAVLCLGPKRSGDRFTPQDEEMLAVLRGALAASFFFQQAETLLAEDDQTYSAEQAEGAPGDVRLTRMEQVVLSLAAQGLSTPQIATRLDRSEKSVEEHLTGAYRKLGVHRRGDAVRLAAQGQLLLPPTALGLADVEESIIDDTSIPDSASRQRHHPQNADSPVKGRSMRRKRERDP